jgi:Uma2 family endonuclease
MTEAFDWSWLKTTLDQSEITLDAYLSIPEELGKHIEVVDGYVVTCAGARPRHQGLQLNLLLPLRDAVKSMDARDGTCHRVYGDVDVLISEKPRLHVRRPDVVVYRCVEEKRGNWDDRPLASDCMLALEIVSPDSVTTDLRDKRAEYAAAGIPRYWIVRMEDNYGPAISVDRLVLTANGDYVREELAVRRADFHAVKIGEPFAMRLTWEQLDDGL